MELGVCARVCVCGGECYFMIMLSLCTPTNEGSERMS